MLPTGRLSIHASTGGQRTLSPEIPLVEVARACGYPRAERVGEAEALQAALGTFWREPGPALLLVTVEPGNPSGLGRVEIEPPEMALRFRRAAIGS